DGRAVSGFRGFELRERGGSGCRWRLLGHLRSPLKNPARATRTGRWRHTLPAASSPKGPAAAEIPMNAAMHAELIRFARADTGSTVIDVWPGGGDWTRLFSDIVGPEGRVYDFVPAELADFKSDPAAFNRAVHERLKPGGSYVIVDHPSACTSL